MISQEKYKKIQKIGMGSYGDVYAVCSQENSQSIDESIYAMKKLKPWNPNAQNHEAEILRSFDHQNIIKIIDQFQQNNMEHLVLEFCVTNLYNFFKSNYSILTNLDKRYITQSLFKALLEIHEKKIMHLVTFLYKDISLSNILIDKNGTIKISDFGLSQKYESGKSYPKNPVSRNQKPPEVLFGADQYNPSVDLWSFGCILGHIYLNKPIFEGTNDMEQIGLIISNLNEQLSEWPEAKDLPYFMSFESNVATGLDKFISTIPDEVQQIIRQLLILNPQKRISLQELKENPYFSQEINLTQCSFQQKITELYQKFIEKNKLIQ